jgi:hypothetical protein
MRKIRSIGLCAVVALALSIVGAQSAPAEASSGTVLVLKAGGQVVPDGALVHVTAPSYFFKSKVTVEGTEKTAAKEEEVECSTEWFEQGKIQRDLAANAWHIVETAGIDFCEGEEWFAGHAMEHLLTFTGPNIVTDESTVELFRTEEQIKAEEKEQFEHEEPIRPREPKRCVYKTTANNGHFRSRKEAPLVARIKGKMALSPSQSNPGCGAKANWKGTFTLSYKGQPIVAAFE